MAQDTLDTMATSSKTNNTAELCTWIQNVTLGDVPEDVRLRAKHLILDGLACAIVGAHLPWTEKAVNAILKSESPGIAPIFGWEKVRYSSVISLPGRLLTGPLECESCVGGAAQ